MGRRIRLVTFSRSEEKSYCMMGIRKWGRGISHGSGPLGTEVTSMGHGWHCFEPRKTGVRASAARNDSTSTQKHAHTCLPKVHSRVVS